jgi:hypothetical protein
MLSIDMDRDESSLIPRSSLMREARRFFLANFACHPCREISLKFAVHPSSVSYSTMNFMIIILLLLLSQSAITFQAATGSCFQNCLLLI